MQFFYKLRILVLASVSAVAVGLGTVAIWSALDGASSHDSASAAKPATPAPVAAVDKREVTLWAEFSGRLEAIERVDLRPRVGGTIQAVHFREGSLVKKGALLFTIDPDPYRTEVERAEAQVSSAEARLAFAHSELDRGMRMTANQTITQRDLDTRANNVREAEANLSAANAAAKSARLNLSYTEVRAPISGRVGRIEVTAGNLVTEGASAPVLTTLVSIDPIYVSFDADESAVLRALQTLPAGRDRSVNVSSIPVEMRSGPNATAALGKVQLIDNTVNSSSGTVRVRAVFDNADDRLMPGQFARIRLGQAKSTAALVVPDRAIGTDQDKKYVLVVDQGQTASYREITTGASIDGLRIVTSGLAAGERIVVDGLQKVRPGTLIAPQPASLDTSASLRSGSSSASIAD